MIGKTIIITAVAAMIGSAAGAAPADYKLEGDAKVVGTTTELTVRVLHVPTGKYVPNASVWHVDRHQGVKAGLPASETRHRFTPDGAGGYRITLPLHVRSDPTKDVYAAVPGEAERLYAAMKPATAR